MDGFVNLHNHFDHSVLDGAMTVDGGVAEAVRLQQPALAMTDHGSLGGSYSFWRAAGAAGIKPIIGLEAYISPAERTLKEPVFFGTQEQRKEDNGGGGKYNHITLLAINDAGLRNLFRLHHDAYAVGFYGKPRIDVDTLSTHNEGLVCLTGCLGGRLQTHLKLGQPGKARDWLVSLKDIFQGRLLIEIMEHGIPIEWEINPQLVELSKVFKVPLVATSDAHYATAGGADIHDTLLCVQTKAKKSAEERFRFEGEGYYLHPSLNMEALFHETPEAVTNTLAVAEMVEEYTVFKRQLRLPVYSHNEELDIEDQAVAGLRSKGIYSGEYVTRLQGELDVINGQGYAGYFLTLADILDMWRRNGIRTGPGRGSAGGSLVAFALGITAIDPIEHTLLFERFLNPERISLPDIDTDIDDSQRDTALQLVREKFGTEYVAQVGTNGTIGAKSAIRDSARALSYPQRTADQLVSLLPPAKFGRQPSLAELPRSAGPEEILAAARGMEGLIRSTGIHASAVVISPDNMVDLLPLKIPGGKRGLTTELTGDEIESLGFVKYDFLGLTALGVVDATLRHETLRLCGQQLPTTFDDKATFEHLATGETAGIFQLEGSGMRKLLTRVKPRTLEDVATVIALYRPGPMGANAHTQYADRKNGKARVEYPHPEFSDRLSSILSPTFGLIVFQEQILQSLAAVGGYTYASAGLIFDAMRKKDAAKMEAARPEFEERLLTNGFSKVAVANLWDILVPFADYSFNKAHAIGYAMIVYWMVYLKIHYPREFFCALLSAEKDPAKLGILVNSAYEYGVPILAPDINSSQFGWTVVPEGVRFGLGAIKGVSKDSYANVIRQRPYKDMADFWERADAKALNLAVVRALVCSGATDGLEPAREGLEAELEFLVARATEARKLADKGTRKLFARWDVTDHPNVAARRCWEEETLGFVFSQPPVVIKLARPLTVDEWKYIDTVVKKYRGQSKVTIQLAGGAKLDGPSINLEGARMALSALSPLEILG